MNISDAGNQEVNETSNEIKSSSYLLKSIFSGNLRLKKKKKKTFASGVKEFILMPQ